MARERHDNLEFHFEGPYRLAKGNGKFTTSESRRAEGARLFRERVLGDRDSVTIEGVNKMVGVLKENNIALSYNVGRELADSIDGFSILCSDGGYLDFRVFNEGSMRYFRINYVTP